MATFKVFLSTLSFIQQHTNNSVFMVLLSFFVLLYL